MRGHQLHRVMHCGGVWGNICLMMIWSINPLQCYYDRAADWPALFLPLSCWERRLRSEDIKKYYWHLGTLPPSLLPLPPPPSPLSLSLLAGAFPQMLIVVNTAQYWVLRPASLPSICQTRARVSSLVSVGVSTHGEVSGFSPAGWVVGMVTPYQSQILLGFSWSTQESSGQSRASLWWRGDGRDDGKERDDGDDGPLTPHLGAPLLRFKWYHCWQAKWVNRLQT